MRINSVAVKDEIEQLKKRGIEIVETAKKEVRDLTEEEETEIRNLKEQIADKQKTLKEVEERAQALTFETPEEPNKETRNNSNSMNQKEVKFSLLKAIRNVVNNQKQDAVEEAVMNAGREQLRSIGQTTDGQIVIPSTRSAFTVTTEGEDVVQTTVAPDFIMGLRNNSVLAKAGARFISGLTGDLQYPKLGKGSVTFEGEVADGSDGTPTAGSVKLTPKRITAVLTVSRKALLQSTPDLEQALMTDIQNAVGEKIESAFFSNFSGSTTQYEGIFSIAPVSGTVSTFQGLVDKEADLDDANIGGNRCYVLGNKAKAALRGMAKGSKSTQLVYENGEVDGTPAYNTSAVEGKKFVYGDFSNVLIGNWVSTITVDPYTLAHKSEVRIVIDSFVDVAVAREEAFVSGELA